MYIQIERITHRLQHLIDIQSTIPKEKLVGFNIFWKLHLEKVVVTHTAVQLRICDTAKGHNHIKARLLELCLE